MTLLQLKGIRRNFQIGDGLFSRPKQLRAVDDVSLSVEPGETLALVGESGCGKSTLGRIVAGLLAQSGGEILFDGRPPASGKARARQIQIVFQDPYGSLNPKMSVGELIAEPALLHGLISRREQTRRIAELLRLVGLDPAVSSRAPHELSGGQRQRVAIARALAAEPRLIVCDEAVSALDVSVQAQIANLLKDIQRRTGVSLLFISHGLSLVHHICDRVAVMYLGRIVEQGPVDDVFLSPRHPYTRSLIMAAPEPVAGERAPRTPLEGEIPSPLDLPSGCRFRGRCPHAQSRCRDSEPSLDTLPHATACWLADDLVPFERAQVSMSPRMAKVLDLYRKAAAERFPKESP